MRHYVYQTTHDATGRFYIGVRSCKRRPESDPYLGSGTVIVRLVRKHGRDAFSKTILSTHESREEAIEAETAIVTPELLGDPLCVNINLGGSGAPVASKETREKSGKVHEGKPKSAEHRAKIAATLKGRKTSTETRANIAAARNARAPASPETRANIAAGARRRWARARAAKKAAE